MRNCLGDNYHVEVRASGIDHFEVAMSLAFNGREARYWAESPTFGLIFMWYCGETEKSNTDRRHYRDNGKTITENYPIITYDEPRSVGQLLDFTQEWLVEKIASLPEPDHDGSNDPGFHISTGDFWGHVGCHHGAICCIKPYWMMLGK